jgi:hypothetical protein
MHRWGEIINHWEYIQFLPVALREIIKDFEDNDFIVSIRKAKGKKSSKIFLYLVDNIVNNVKLSVIHTPLTSSLNGRGEGASN